MLTNKISESTHIPPSSTIGHFCVIGNNVQIGENVEIGHHVVIHDDVCIGNNVVIGDHCVLGKLPFSAKRSAPRDASNLAATKIETACVLGSGAILYRGAHIGSGSLVADYATVREKVQIGEETIIGRGVCIEHECQIGARCKLETNVYVTAFSRIGDDCFLAPCAATSNDPEAGRGQDKIFKGITMENGARLGVNSTVLPGKTLKQNAFAAAGSVITKDVAPNQIVAGVPAKEFKDVPEQHRLAAKETK